MKNKKNHLTGIIVWSVLSALFFLITPLLMYVIYIIYARNDPGVSITVGYWVGFISAIIPLLATLYGYSLKLSQNDDKGYLWPFWFGITFLFLTLLLTFAGLSIDMPLN